MHKLNFFVKSSSIYINLSFNSHTCFAGALTAQLNYYRANSTFVRESTENLDDGKDGMFILGDKELYVSPIAITRMSNEYPKLRVEVIPGANHFVHQDAPKQTNALLRDFFGSASNYKVETIE